MHGEVLGFRGEKRAGMGFSGFFLSFFFSLLCSFSGGEGRLCLSVSLSLPLWLRAPLCRFALQPVKQAHKNKE
jgi:hypothetical protein